jgi:hypothetical protein
MTDFVDIGPQCFSDKEQTVINYRGENFYRACGAPVGLHSSCVKRINHPSPDHEDFAGTTSTQPPRSDGLLIKTRSIMRYGQKFNNQDGTYVAFYSYLDESRLVIDRRCIISLRDWVAMGEPREITMTVEPGDTITPDRTPEEVKDYPAKENNAT